MFQARTAIVMLCAALTTLFSLPTLAQSSRGKIAGVVIDANGAPVVGATIAITNQQTGTTRAVRTSAAGTYEVTDLAPGIYGISADMPGFGRVTKVVTFTGADLTVDLAMEVKASEEIKVTARKREETVLDTPVSVAAPTEEVLRERGVESLEDVAANVAGFAVQNLGPAQNQVSMRGVSSGQIARDQPGVKEQVGAYLDESVISLSLFTPDIDLFDMNRIEVLRGPQGTLFGSGSLSGTVRYITNPPELGATRYFGEFAGSTISGGDVGGNAKAGFNVPLGSTAALRVAAYWDRFGGYMDSVQPDLSIKEDVNSGDRTGVRAAVQIAPDDRLTILPRIAYQKMEMDGWNRIDIFNILANPFTTTRPAVTLGGRKNFTQIDEPVTDEFLLGDLTVKYDFGGVALTSVTSYTDRDILVVRDATALSASVTGGSIGLPENVYTLDAPLLDATQATGWTQELRLSGGPDRFRWVAGGFYADSTRDYGQSVPATGFTALSGIPTAGQFGAKTDELFFSDLNYDFRQFALFGEGTLAVGDRLSLTGGLRYYDYKEDRVQTFDGIFSEPGTNAGSTQADGVAPRFIASYRVTESTNVNAQIAKGFRLGGINDPLNIPLCTVEDRVTFGGRDSWKDETAWNYEIGSKSRIMGGRGSFNVSAFYVDIRDLQVTVTAGSCSSRLIFNVPKARSVGGEIEFAAALSDSFDFAISAGYADAELRSTVTAPQPGGGAVIVAGIEEGKRLPSVPEFQMAAAATYQREVKPGFVGYVSGTYTHVGSRFTQVGDEDLDGTLNLLSFAPNTIGGPLTQSTFTFDPELPAYDLVNLRFGVRFSNFDVALFANNLTDERAFLSLDRERGLRARIGYQTNQPRTIGISTRVDF